MRPVSKESEKPQELEEEVILTNCVEQEFE
jgi:hypothetical protein